MWHVGAQFTTHRGRIPADYRHSPSTPAELVRRFRNVSLYAGEPVRADEMHHMVSAHADRRPFMPVDGPRK